jgi:hypothetical protein
VEIDLEIRNMRIHAKPIMALASGAILLLAVLCQPAHAQGVVDTGVSLSAAPAITDIPEPSTVILFLAGSLSMLRFGWRKRSS